MLNQPKIDTNLAINELIFLENHINALIKRTKHNGEYAKTKQEKTKVITEIQLLERLLDYAQDRKSILQTVQNSGGEN